MGELAFVALGSNLGESRQILREAMDRLRSLSNQPTLESSVWETTPIDCPPGSPRFLNAVVGLVPRPGETPESLLQQLQKLEVEFGRRRKVVLNEARPLDLDILVFGSESRAAENLVL